MTTSSDELVGKLSAMTISGAGDEESVGGDVPLVENCIDLLEEDPYDSIQHTNVVGFRDRTTESVYGELKDFISWLV
jgi:hypothetical protein